MTKTKGTPMRIDGSKAGWQREFASVANALAPYAIVNPQGFSYIDEAAAPPHLVRYYRQLVQVGYARGFAA
jgi:hypothetical protein